MADEKTIADKLKSSWLFTGGKKQQERIFLIVAGGFVACVLALIILTDGAFLRSPWKAVISLAQPENRGVALNCMKAKNKNTPYCRNRRTRVKEQWDGISQGGSKPFSLN